MPTIVIVYRPAGTEEPTVTVTTLTPVSGLGVKDNVTPTGSPKYVNIAEFVPSKFVKSRFTVPDELGATTITGGTVWRRKLT